MVMTAWMIGCANAAAKQDIDLPGASVESVREFLNEGELYQARKMARALLEKNPKDEQLQELMAQVIDRELATEQELTNQGKDLDLNSDEMANEARTWLERSEALLQIEQYDQALLAAEKVFLYDPDNHQASRLIDRIKKEGIKSGKGQIQSEKQARHEEVLDRVSSYRKQAEVWIESGKWGAAKLAVEKILLLVPEDPEALRLQERIKKHNEHPSSL